MGTAIKLKFKAQKNQHLAGFFVHAIKNNYSIERPFLAAVRKRKAFNLMNPAASF